MGKYTEKLKSALVHHESPDIPAKQIHRWEGEGGAVPLEPEPSRRYFRRRRKRNKPVDGGKAE